MQLFKFLGHELIVIYLYEYTVQWGEIFTDRNFVDNFLQVVIYLALVANI